MDNRDRNAEVALLAAMDRDIAGASDDHIKMFHIIRRAVFVEATKAFDAGVDPVAVWRAEVAWAMNLLTAGLRMKQIDKGELLKTLGEIK